jgi:hypothetical protein
VDARDKPGHDAWKRNARSTVMPALVAGIHVFPSARQQAPAHDIKQS